MAEVEHLYLEWSMNNQASINVQVSGNEQGQRSGAASVQSVQPQVRAQAQVQAPARPQLQMQQPMGAAAGPLRSP